MASRGKDRFDRPVEIPVRKLVEDLEIFMREAAFLDFDDRGLKDWSVLQDLSMEGEALTQHLYGAGLLD